MDPLVLIAGAGPVGSALALDLHRRDVRVRLIDRAASSFPGSRAKGVQPRTQEVLEDLGVLDALLAGSSSYPKLAIHLGPLRIPKAMFASHPSSAATPHPNIVLSPQSNTDAVLHAALRDSGVLVEYDTELLSLHQDENGVTATLSSDEVVRADYLVGADGGSSTVRRAAGISFTGKTDDADRMIIADVQIPKLRRDRWHIWPGSAGRFLGACPLPGGDLFQVMLRLPRDIEIDRDPENLKATIRDSLGRKRLSTGGFTWVSLFRPNIRLADRYRNGRVFLAGDAAHAHTPAGGQGLNTGVQDSYNLGWKLGQVLAGASPDLLDSYESERRPIAAGVLKLSTERYEAFEKSTKAATTRGDEERQLLVNYRGGPLTSPEPVVAGSGALAPGDRLPDALDQRGRRVFEYLAGPDFGVIGIGHPAGPTVADLGSARGASVRAVDLPAGTYGITTPTLILVRPDGYIAALTAADRAEPIAAALRLLRP